jgi:hypothetical protein
VIWPIVDFVSGGAKADSQMLDSRSKPRSTANEVILAFDRAVIDPRPPAVGESRNVPA